MQSIAGSRELIGPEVVMAHRLLKNHAGEAAATRLEIPSGAGIDLSETYEHYAPIAVRVYALR